ncbi:MAG: pyruvate, phosphate dikinase [Candidatus Hydrogenedentes bacterium]|nr:pyruvate, phosphate dikinase [Candidatus Hydrogenedentota bacterium]
MDRPNDLTTGVAALDTLLLGIEAGDNIVWQVESVADYAVFATVFTERAITNGRKTVYVRFGRHAPLLTPRDGLTILAVDPQAGFEPFIDSIHSEIARAGRGAFYVFDCLSDLLADWISDQMIGNFFMLTCPFLYDMDTIAYFALLRDAHAEAATVPIRKTTQLLIDLYRNGDKVYLRPIKVRGRFLRTLHMLHVLQDGRYRSVTESHILAEVLTRPIQAPPSPLESWNRIFPDSWQRAAILGATLVEGEADRVRSLLRMMVSRDARVLALAERYLTLDDLQAIGRRIVGTGLIGGKAVGMLLAQAILRRHDPQWATRLETHDSFYIASDVFYTFLVENGCWWIRKNQKNPEALHESASQARRRILTGTFSPALLDRFRIMLEYYGRSPIIVRSSSLLEDNFGNAFAGKYESVFCANQGSPDQRLEEFLNAVKRVYASSMGEEALAYRTRHGLLHLDEQMALLVQRVSGSEHGRFFYPHLAGVCFSFNPYVWNHDIDPNAGLLRLVFGLGTRAVDRSDQDYTRVIALNAPGRRPEGDGGDGAPLAQHRVDLLDLRENALRTVDFEEAVAMDCDLPIDLFAPVNAFVARRLRETGAQNAPPRFLTFDGLFKQTTFIEDVRSMLSILQEAYACPVDVEIAANLPPEGGYRLNVLQCRPLQIHSGSLQESLPNSLPAECVLLKSCGPVIGRSRSEAVRRLIYVDPAGYSALRTQDRYAVARLIGQWTHLPCDPASSGALLLVGPGRWGTRSPELGVPVTFAEIDRVDILCELVAMREDLVPDVSMGTHFFSELVEIDMLYTAVFPNQSGNIINLKSVFRPQNRVRQPDSMPAAYADIIQVYDLDGVRLHADTMRQEVICFRSLVGT